MREVIAKAELLFVSFIWILVGWWSILMAERIQKSSGIRAEITIAVIGILLIIVYTATVMDILK